MPLFSLHAIVSDRDISSGVRLPQRSLLMGFNSNYRPDHHQGVGYRDALAGPESFRVWAAGHD